MRASHKAVQGLGQGVVLIIGLTGAATVQSDDGQQVMHFFAGLIRNLYNLKLWCGWINHREVLKSADLDVKCLHFVQANEDNAQVFPQLCFCCL